MANEPMTRTGIAREPLYRSGLGAFGIAAIGTLVLALGLPRFEVCAASTKSEGRPALTPLMVSTREAAAPECPPVKVVSAGPAPSAPPETAAHPEVQDFGVPVAPSPHVRRLFHLAGVHDPSVIDVILAVSRCEGGFNALNTIDAGIVSVGFMQFTTSNAGRGYKLVDVLGRLKRDEAERTAKHGRNEFDAFFRERGIDVRDGDLFVWDRAAGRELTGSEAVNAIRTKRRLSRLFQVAGVNSTAFQLAQVEEAYRAFYLAGQSYSIPAARVVRTDIATGQRAFFYAYGAGAVADAEHRVRDHGEPSGKASEERGVTAESWAFETLPDLRGTYGEALPSEAAQAALMDRAVQHGVTAACRAFEGALQATFDGQEITAQSLHLREPDMIARLVNRIDVLNDTRLSQPWVRRAEIARSALHRRANGMKTVGGESDA